MDGQTQLLYDEQVLLPELRAAGVGLGEPGLEAEGLVYADNLDAHR